MGRPPVPLEAVAVEPAELDAEAAAGAALTGAGAAPRDTIGASPAEVEIGDEVASGVERVSPHPAAMSRNRLISTIDSDWTNSESFTASSLATSSTSGGPGEPDLG
jgi:hypothetical protein